MQKIGLSSQHLDYPACKKYNYSYFKPNYVMARKINQHIKSKSYHQYIASNVPTSTVLKGFKGQKNKWQELRNRMRIMKIDEINNGRQRQNTSKDNKNNSQSEKKQVTDFFYKLRNPQKQQPLNYRKNQSLNYIKHLQAYCSTHFQNFDKQEGLKTQMLTSNSKQNNENRTRLTNTGSTEYNRYDRRVTEVYKSNSIARRHVDRISIKRPIGPIEDLITHPQDITNRLIVQRKTLVQNKMFYALQLSIIHDRYVFIVNIMGQKTKKLSLVLNKQQSRIISRQFNNNLKVLLDNLVIGMESLTLKQSFLKILEQKQKEYRESKNMRHKQKNSHPYLDYNRRLGTPATNLSSQQQKRYQKARTSISQLRKNDNKQKINYQDTQLSNQEANPNASIQEQPVISELKNQIGQSKIINSISEQISKDIKYSIQSNSEVIQNLGKSKHLQKSQLPNQSIKKQNNLQRVKKEKMANNSFARANVQGIQQKLKC